ncbi:hypothetical protein [Streptomyces olivaceus]|uniref:hypothetical protein n=1 Tax=Streptomyces olivaceus TaxID=47716 RepID=UPI003798A6E4
MVHLDTSVPLYQGRKITVPAEGHRALAQHCMRTSRPPATPAAAPPPQQPDRRADGAVHHSDGRTRTSSDIPTAHDLALALASLLRPGAAPRDVAISLHARRQAAAQYDHTSVSGPVTGYAQALHAALYGLPEDNAPLPAALDALLQATHTAKKPEQKTAILRQLADQLRNAADILQLYQHRAQWDRLPEDVATHLRTAHDQAQQIATALDRVAPAFSSTPSTTPTSLPQTVQPAVPPVPPARQRR